MGCAVVALHYTGMAGVRVTLDPSMPAPEGMTVMSLLFPAFVLGIIVLAVPITALLLASDPEDAVRDARLEQWRRRSNGRWTATRSPDPTCESSVPDGSRHVKCLSFSALSDLHL